MSDCKGCGKPIVWMKSEAGKNIPLDPKPPVYKIDRDFSGAPICRLISDDSYMVSHFATCPKANMFSASNRAPS